MTKERIIKITDLIKSILLNYICISFIWILAEYIFKGERTPNLMDTYIAIVSAMVLTIIQRDFKRKKSEKGLN